MDNVVLKLEAREGNNPMELLQLRSKLETSRFTGNQRRSVRWFNLVKFDVGFLNFWSDVLFAAFLYQEWENKSDNAILGMFISSALILSMSWIDQLVCHTAKSYRV